MSPVSVTYFYVKQSPAALVKEKKEQTEGHESTGVFVLSFAKRKLWRCFISWWEDMSHFIPNKCFLAFWDLALGCSLPGFRF